MPAKLLLVSLQREADRPLIIGHRGLKSDKMAENSIEAFRAALEAGADGVECDIRLGADGSLFCCHDRLHQGRPVEALLEAERKAAGFPLFLEVAELLEDYPGRGLWIESKTMASAEALLSSYEPRPCYVMISFSDQATIAASLCGWETVLLGAASADVLRDLAPDRLGPSAQMSLSLSDQELSRASVWTVDDLALAEALNERSVWALTTNYPKQLLEFFSSPLTP